MRDRTLPLLALALLATPACLPAGDPPTGQHIWAGRERSVVGVLPARTPDDGVTRILTMRPDPAGLPPDLSLMSMTSSGAVIERTLVERWTCDGINVCPEVDYKGRVLVWSVPAGQSTNDIPLRTFSRIDIDTGERTDVEKVAQFQQSSSRRRVAVSAGSWGGDGVSVLGADDEPVIELPSARAPAFVGEDLYLVHDTDVLGRLSPDGAAIEEVRRGVKFFEMLATTNGPRLLLHLSGPDAVTVGGLALLDPITGDERALPYVSGQNLTVSPDGQWALIYTSAIGAARKFTLFEVSTGAEESLELPVEVGVPEWRPRRAELWFIPSDWTDRSAFVKRPGQPLRRLPTTVFPAVGLSGSMFSADGSRLFSFRPLENGNLLSVFVGDADEPDGPRFPLNPQGTRLLQYRELPDGRLVVEAFYSQADRSDIFLVDPEGGATRILGTNGGVVSIGTQRVLAMTHRVDQAADLEVIDVDVDQSTRLATEFAVAAYVQPRLDDPDLARPGAPVVFQFRARFVSPHDGLWLTTLP